MGVTRCVCAGAGVRLCVPVLSESLCAVAVTLTVFGGWGRCAVHVRRRVSATQRTPSLRDCTRRCLPSRQSSSLLWASRRLGSRGAPLTKLQLHFWLGRAKGVVSVSPVPTRMSSETPLSEHPWDCATRARSLSRHKGSRHLINHVPRTTHMQPLLASPFTVNHKNEKKHYKTWPQHNLHVHVLVGPSQAAYQDRASGHTMLDERLGVLQCK